MLLDFYDLDTDYAPCLAMKPVNDAAGPLGIDPSLLVFGVFFCLPIFLLSLPDIASRMSTLHVVREEIAKVGARARLDKALQCNVPAAADKRFNVGEPVL